MKKNTWNILIDALCLVVFMAMISTGLILKFVLPPGNGRMEMLYSGAGRKEKAIDLYLGLARHEWGEIHFYISMTFLVLLIAHLVLHWSWMAAVSFGTANAPQSMRRKILSGGIIILVILAIVFPWIGKKKTVARSDVEQMRR